MKFQFDPGQKHQLDAIAAVVDLFDGQPRGELAFSVVQHASGTGLFAGQQQTELGLGNELRIDAERLRHNARAVQERNEIEVSAPDAKLSSWELDDAPLGSRRRCPHFSIEMETGTGKTYVYLRTVFELARRYGFKKFLVVVPSVAIREGVLQSIRSMAEHFRELFDRQPFEHFVYDAKDVQRLRGFAGANTIQLGVINIQAFDKKDLAVIYKPTDRLSQRTPIEFIQAARPIVIIDEPQSIEGGEGSARLEALKELNPLCTLRYSATHRDAHELVYRLDPVRAFDLGLVKKIVVGNARGSGGANDAYVRVESVATDPFRAKLRIHVKGAGGTREKVVTAKTGADLHQLSGELDLYREGWLISEIWAKPGEEFVAFSNGRRLARGEESGGLRDDVWMTQIRLTVKRHLEKELQVAGRSIKVLSLFFIDKVANYRVYETNGPKKGRFAAAIESILAEFAVDPRYGCVAWLKLPVENLHNGYFAADKSGSWKDTKGTTQADEGAYELIMQNKEQLLSIDEPLRFLFSHSALREGWDNPNVFQICTLNQTASGIRKRQEIGRGLRLPVDQSGRRIFDENVNQLFVMANESYEDFARALQEEYEKDCGVTFGKVPLGALARILRPDGEHEVPVGRDAAIVIQKALVGQGLLDKEGRILPAFDPTRRDFAVQLPPELAELAPAVVDLISTYRMERHLRPEKEERQNHLKRRVLDSPEFRALWDRIKPRTTYRVEFETSDLIALAVAEVRRMPRIEKPRIEVTLGGLDVTRAGILSNSLGASSFVAEGATYGVPDILRYLQNETELTRGTLVEILKRSGRLGEVFEDPQRFLDEVASILKHTLRRLLVDGIKYEQLVIGDQGVYWEMTRFAEKELVDYLSSLPVQHSIYEHVSYDSDVERAFAKKLDERPDIKLFVKLPRWFEIETPLGSYNPDWAILKDDGKAVYLARETKGTKDFLKLRTEEAGKVRCGKKHFDSIGVDFQVVVTADEV